MRHPIQVVLFDVGNTLLYDDPIAWPEIYRRAEAALWASLSEAGVGISPRILYGPYDSLLRYYYGVHRNDLGEPGTARVLNELLSSQGAQIPESRLRKALSAMYGVTQTNWLAEDDAVPTLQGLRAKGLRLGAVTNVADDRNARQLLETSGLRPFLELVLTSVAFGQRKPSPGIFRSALGHFDVPPERAVMVGDTYEADILGAAAIGMNTIWIKRRVREAPANQSVMPDAVVASLGEIEALLP